MRSYPEFKILRDVKVYVPDVHMDERGDLWTIWKKGQFSDLEFNHDKVSTSKASVLRGIHGDNKSWKLVTCLYGLLYFVVVDNRPDSPTYLKHENILLSGENKWQVLIPPNFGNGFYSVRDSVFHYKWAYPGEYPDVADQFTLRWNDPKIGIHWPSNHPILSNRDKDAKFLDNGK